MLCAIQRRRRLLSNTWTIRQRIDLDSGYVQPRILPTALMMQGDKNAHTWEIAVFRHGQAVELAGTVRGYFQRGGGASESYVPVDGTLSGNVASVRLKSECYAKPGPLLCVMRLSSPDATETVTLGTMVARVEKEPSGAVVDPEHVVPDLETLLAQIAACEEATAGANAAAGAAGEAATAANSAAASVPAAINAQKGVANGICPLDAQGRVPGEYIGSIEAPKYGASGVGGSSPTLKRLWDAKGLVAAVGTDSATAVNDFDNLPPFNRRKFVGSVTVADGKTYVTPASWYGDADYAEDGSMGDYVAVRCYKTYYYQDMAAGIVGVSAYHQPGWSLHPLFFDEDGNELDYVDLPCYALALNTDGKAVSLPGLRNECGHWSGLWTSCRSYNGDAGAYASMMPIAVSHYETLLAMVEFATTNLQSIMAGFTSGRYAADAVDSVIDSTHIVVTATIGGYHRAGQNVYINTTYSEAAKASHAIQSIEPCDPDGTPNASGTHRLITLAPYPGAKDITTVTAPTINNRPYNTGACAGVLTPSGSPVSNSDGRYPCRYRWRENPWGNQMMTCQDLMDVRVEVAADTYKLQWYHLPKLDAYMGVAIANPSTAAALNDKGWVLLDTETPPDRYADGYIKEMTPDPDHPEIWIPTLTAGGSASTFFADYAYLVNSNVVRAVRVGGSWSYGSTAGPWSRIANSAPSIANANYGAGLYFSRRGCAA